MEFNFISYMRQLSVTHHLLQHSDTNKRFYLISSIEQLEELLNNPKAKYPLICVNDDDSARIFDNSADYIWERKPFSFYVLSNFRNGLDMAEKNSQKTICKQIGFDVLSKLIQDRKYDLMGKPPLTGLRNLDVNSFTYFSIGPLLDNVTGYEFFFSLERKLSVKFVPNHWIS